MPNDTHAIQVLPSSLTYMEGFQVLAMRARSNLESLQIDRIPGTAPLIARVRIEVMALESRIKSAGQKVISAASPEGQELLARADLLQRIARQVAYPEPYGSCEGHPMPQPGMEDA